MKLSQFFISATSAILLGVKNGVHVLAFAPTTLRRSQHGASELQARMSQNNDEEKNSCSRRNAIVSSFSMLAGILATGATSTNVWAESDGGFNVDDFLKSGQVSMPMGVSGQAGKSKPETGIVFRDGSELSRDGKTGDVLTEILLNARSDDPTAVIATFSSPWPLGM
jgi:hypothetical protein